MRSSSNFLFEMKKKIDFKITLNHHRIQFNNVQCCGVEEETNKKVMLSKLQSTSLDTKLISIDWLSMIYMLTYIPLIFPMNWILNKWGLRVTLLVASLLNAIGGCIKCVAGLVTYETTFGLTNPQPIPWTHKFGFPILMTGQTICGIAQTGLLGIPAHLAAVWFGANEVSTATALGVFGNQLGVAFGFLIPPLILPPIPYSVSATDKLDPSVDPSELFSRIKHYMMIMLYFSAALNILPFVCVLFGFRAKPKTEPSLAQHKRTGNNNNTMRKRPLTLTDRLSIVHQSANGIHSVVNNNATTITTTMMNNNNHNSLHENSNNMDKELNANQFISTKPTTSNNEMMTDDSIMANNFIVHVDGDDAVVDKDEHEDDREDGDDDGVNNHKNTIDSHSYQSLRSSSNMNRNENITAALKRLFKNIPFVLLFISYGK
ncbi:unnamed protein product [Schistosoma turkestanicum]|nr:unnamed protein product [Schistosoma turkestanicum]